ncbi:hypothetical protein GCM10010404_27710 [Nonomuraea africana]
MISFQILLNRADFLGDSHKLQILDEIINRDFEWIICRTNMPKRASEGAVRKSSYNPAFTCYHRQLVEVVRTHERKCTFDRCANWDLQNFLIFRHKLTNTKEPGRLYLHEMKASLAWYGKQSGDH